MHTTPTSAGGGSDTLALKFEVRQNRRDRQASQFAKGVRLGRKAFEVDAARADLTTAGPPRRGAVTESADKPHL
jgi:hypothetical protein